MSTETRIWILVLLALITFLGLRVNVVRARVEALEARIEVKP